MSLCIGFGCSTRPRNGLATCAGHAGLEPTSPPCPDGHGELAFVVVSAVRLGGALSLMYACPLCDYVTQVDYPPARAAAPRGHGASEADPSL